MLRFVFQKIRNKGWLSFCQILGLTFLVACFSCIPSFKYGALDRTVGTLFETALEETQSFPAVLSRESTLNPGAYDTSEKLRQAVREQSDAWQHYIKGLREDSPAEFATAETLHKQELAIDLRVQDIIRHTAISKNIPNLP